MQLTEHFTLEEFTRSVLATRYGIANVPSPEAVSNLQDLCLHVLEPLRRHLGHPIRISSGYRCTMVNVGVGGVANSQHTRGEAADIIVSGLMPQAYMFIRDHLPYDQLIMEHTWIHVSYRRGRNRRQEIVIRPNEEEIL